MERDHLSAGGGAARSCATARSTCASSSAPPCWRHGRTELSPTTIRPGEEWSGSGIAEGGPPRLEGPGESGRERVRDVVVAGHREQGEADGVEQGTRARSSCSGLPAVGQVARREQELRLEACDELRKRVERLEGFVRRRWRSERWRTRAATAGAGYTLEDVANESPELFDDIYLGLRAGGAVRKQRRGEPLTSEEEEAIGRWRSLSLWRKIARDRRVRARDVRPRPDRRRPHLRPLAHREALSLASESLPERAAAGLPRA